jgi:hypothetical protein
MGRKRRRWSKKYEKESERLERELAEEKAKDRADSEHRHEQIKVLWDLNEQQLSASKNPKDRKLTEQKLKQRKLKDLPTSIRESTENDDLVDRISELIELVLLQDLEIEYLMKFRRDCEQIEAHYPDRLEDLYIASLLPIFRPGFAAKLRAMREPQNWERAFRLQPIPWRKRIGRFARERRIDTRSPHLDAVTPLPRALRA